MSLKGSIITVFITLLLFFKFKAHVILNNRHDSDSDKDAPRKIGEQVGSDAA